MTETVFSALLDMSIPAGVFILAAALLHKLKVPHRIFVILWLVLGLRLLVPVNLESPLSFYGFAKRFQTAGTQAVSVSGKLPAGMSVKHLMTAASPKTDSNSVPDRIPAGNTEKPAVLTDHPARGLQTAGRIWLLGMCLVLTWGAVSYIRLRLKVRDAVRLKNITLPDEMLPGKKAVQNGHADNLSCPKNVWQSDWISSPFLFGVIRPRIYIPFHMDEEVLRHVLAHEYTHLKNRDYIVKFMWFVITAVYWFHPLVWMAYILLGRDIELSCDEQVIRGMDSHEKTCYAGALLQVSTDCRTLSVYPIAFGKAGVKMRIKHVLNYKKPAVYIIPLCIIVGAALAFGLLTVPSSATETQSQTGTQETLETEKNTPSENDSQSVKEDSVDILTKVSFGATSEIDLNGDGAAETVSADLAHDDGYDPMPELTVSGKTFDSSYMRDTLSFYMADPETEHYYFLDLDTSDSFVEIAFFDYGPSDDPYTYVLRYTGDNLILLGGFSASPDDSSTTIPGDGTVNAVTRCDIIQTDWTMGTWKLAGEKLEEQELTEGEFMAYHERYGSDYPVTAKRDFHAHFADPLSSAVAAIPKGTEVAIRSFKKEKSSSTITIYFSYKDDSGKEQNACVSMKEGDPYTVIVLAEQNGAWVQQEIPSIDLFDGLSFAG